MLKINAETPAYEDYQAAVTFTKEGTEIACPYEHGTPKFDEWARGHREAVADIDTLDKLGAPIVD